MIKIEQGYKWYILNKRLSLNIFFYNNAYIPYGSIRTFYEGSLNGITIDFNMKIKNFNV
jgi:hypothetical protein